MPAHFMPANSHGPSMQRRRLLKNAAGLLGASLSTPYMVGAQTREATRQTGVVIDSRFDLPAFGARHPEQPARVQAVNRVLRASESIDRLQTLAIDDQAVNAAIERVHTGQHVASIGVTYDADINRLARAGVGAVLAGVEAVAAGTVRNAFIASRPPGHHASNTGEEEGFCFFNNIAIAARHVQRNLGFERVLIIDWDYHHGNGTEALFYDDPSVFYFSTHDPEAYPRTGDASRTGQGPGAGYTRNVPLPCGTNDRDMLAVYHDVLVPIARRFDPDFVLISAGFDSRVDDLLGCFALTDEGYAAMTRIVGDIAARHCAGRLVSMLEGGYNVAGLASAALAHVNALVALAAESGQGAPPSSPQPARASPRP